MTDVRLLADIGGTNIRLAWQQGPGSPLRDIQVLQCGDHPTLEDALRTYLDGVDAPAPSEAAFGAATPVLGDEVRMTNHSWAFSQRALREAWGWRRLLVMNDFTALALSLPHLAGLRQVGGGAAEAGAPLALLGPGTGLGVSGLVFSDDQSPGKPMAGEGGHVTLAAESAREFDVLSLIRERHGHASAERAISGAGLVAIHEALCLLEDQPQEAATEPAQVVDLALCQRQPLATEALQLFCGFLGSVAGNLVLTLGARGGVYLGGGIVPRLGTWFDRSTFRARFEAKGRMRSYLAQIPCWVIDPSTQPALLGVSRALDLQKVERP